MGTQVVEKSAYSCINPPEPIPKPVISENSFPMVMNFIEKLVDLNPKGEDIV